MITLEQALQPVGVGTFARDYLHKTWLHVVHTPTEFKSLVPLDALSHAVRSLRTSGGRLKMVKGGEPINSAQYLEEDPDTAQGARISISGLMRQARAGATLVFNFVDEVLPEVSAFAGDCEAQLGAPVHVNLYLSWGVEPGFVMHWDDHDVFVLQIDGRKRWTVCEPTMEFPIREDGAPQPMSPTTTPAFDDDLVPGSVLYLPRGWWHVARAVEPPSLHLTVGLRTQTGVDYLRWAARQLYKGSLGREDVPIPANQGNETNWTRELLQALTAFCSEPDTLSRFRKTWRAGERHRTALDLYGVQPPTPQVFDAPPADGKGSPHIRLLEPMELLAAADGGQGKVLVSCGTIRWHCDPALREPLSRLTNSAEVNVDGLAESLAVNRRSELRLLLETLAASGAATIRTA
jgi:hypothetical protein